MSSHHCNSHGSLHLSRPTWPPRDHPQRIESRRKLALLSDRERDVLTLIGLSNADVAQNLFMSEATIKTYVSRMLTKLGLANRTQAAILAHEAGLYD